MGRRLPDFACYPEGPAHLKTRSDIRLGISLLRPLHPS